MADADLQQELDRIYSLPLAEFIGARNQLAKGLRASGDRQTADEVKALAKPSMTAWAVNALFHHERPRFDDLLAAAAAVRAALAGKGDRGKADAGRRKALQTLLARAAEILAQAGHAVTPANRQRISHTLETLAAMDPSEDGPRPGRLTRDLEPRGFDVLAGFAPSLAAPAAAAGSAKASRRHAGSKKSPDTAATGERADRLETARHLLEERQAAVTRLEQDVEAAEAGVGEALERHEHLTEELAAARRRAEAAAEATAAAKREVAEARATASKAKTARRRALSRLATARRKVERLED